MNVNDIQSYDYVYSTCTKWGLKLYTCDIEYFTCEPLDDLSFVICSILDSNGGTYDKRSMGVLLGFSLLDRVDEGKHIAYYDVAERKMFDDLLELVESQHLITINENVITLTNLGQISIQSNIHYTFYRATKGVYEHLKLKTENPEDLTFFPFFQDMGLYTHVQAPTTFWPNDDEIFDIFEKKDSELIERIKLNSKEGLNIYYTVQQEYFDIEQEKVKIDLYRNKGEYYPVVVANGIARSATDLVNNGLNLLTKENLVLECLFCQLWDDKTAVLDYNTLCAYFDLVDFEELTKDKRTKWNDLELLDVIFANANKQIWKNITRNCDVEVLCSLIERIATDIEWSTFSSRVSDDFLIREFKNYPWDLETISQDYNRDSSVIEKLILQQKATNEDWDWEELESRLSDDFVLTNISIAHVNLTKYTKDTEQIRNLLITNLTARWNWSVVESEFDLEYILNNFVSIAPYLSFDILLDRIFTDAIWEERFVTDATFVTAMQKLCSSHCNLSTLVLNEKDYLWSKPAIRMLTNVGLLEWKSTPYMRGFECNQSIEWNLNFFGNFKDEVVTKEGLSCVSKKICDFTILATYPNWEWDWDAISSNTSLLNEPLLYGQFGSKLNWSIVFDNCDNTQLFENISDIDAYLDDEAWTKFSAIASIDYVMKTFRESHFSWDWKVLTERMYSYLKLEHIGNKLFVDKWDWSYLTANVPTDFLVNNISTYGKYWDWDMFFERVLDSQSKLERGFINRIAQGLSTVDGEICSKAWRAWTHHYTYSELMGILANVSVYPMYKWDILALCEYKEFNIFNDLEKCKEYVDWDKFSASTLVDTKLAYNPKSGLKFNAWKEDVKKLLLDNSDYWDFYSLSSFESLQSQYWFLATFKDKIDWSVISRESSLFCQKDKQKLNEFVDKFKKYINFESLSERTDVDIRQIIKIHPNAKYDFNALMKSGMIDVTIDLVEKTRDYGWDWYAVTSQERFVPTVQFLFDHMDDELNWDYLSSLDLQSVWSNKDLLEEIVKDEDIASKMDWHILTSRNYFPISVSILDKIKDNSLDWDSLSARKNMMPILDVFSNYVNWHVISSNSHINFNDISFLQKYKEQLDWTMVCVNDSFVMNNTILELFANYIDWSIASASLNINFTRTLVERFVDRWNWPILVKNKAFHNRLNIADLPFARQINIVEFVKQFPCVPKAYHFTHMSNAISILHSMKLQSRDLAEGQFSNSAGTNVYRTSKAHRFARFYFAPKSPTQFYNECLGKDENMKYYSRALNLGLPKCPMPVFLVFDIEELLMAMPEKCYYSDGNMQKDATRCYKVIENPNMIKARGIYINCADTKDERQQEFLIDGELDFSRLSKVQIYCYDEWQASLLRAEVQDTRWKEAIEVNRTLYVNENRELSFHNTSETIRISSNYGLPYELRVSYPKDMPHVINSNMVSRHKGNDIYLRNSVELEKDMPFKVYFEVDRPVKGSWLIYENK